jgi:serine protease Do
MCPSPHAPLPCHPRRSHTVGRIALVMFSVLCLGAFATAQDAIDQSRRNAIVTAIERAAPAVVTINVVQIKRERLAVPMDDFWGLFGPRLHRQRTMERAVESIGSGFLFDPRGYILTNYHVLAGADAISSVTLPGGRDLAVEFVGADERTDLAVLRAKEQDLPVAAFGDSEDLLVGEWVIAIGNPFGNMMRDPQPSVSVGVVSAKHRRVSREVGDGETSYQDLLQTDAAINPGNSGGPLVNSRGEVIGVNTMIFSNNGGHQGLGFAIPANRARRVAEEIIAYGKRRDPWMGFHGEALSDLQPYAVRQLGLQAESGVLVTEMKRSTPAEQAGLSLGDVIVEMNGQPVTHPLDVDFITWSLFVGDEVTLKVDRRGEAHELRFKITDLSGTS